MADDVTIEVLDHLTDADAAAIEQLLPQLSRSATFDLARIEAMTRHDATDLLVARLDGSIIGMATLVTFPLPTGLRGHIDDVVVDESLRGRGIARQLLDAITLLARSRQLRTLDLSSRPSRAAAIRLYQSVGFQRRNSLLMRYTPPQP
jgi:ribosomal protein S18 acetylase RimI-like enzyme